MFASRLKIVHSLRTAWEFTGCSLFLVWVWVHHKEELCLIPAKPWDTKGAFCFSAFQVEAVVCGAWIIWYSATCSVLPELQFALLASICCPALSELRAFQSVRIHCESDCVCWGGWRGGKRDFPQMESKNLQPISMKKASTPSSAPDFFPLDAARTCQWEKKILHFPETGLSWCWLAWIAWCAKQSRFLWGMVFCKCSSQEACGAAFYFICWQ